MRYTNIAVILNLSFWLGACFTPNEGKFSRKEVIFLKEIIQEEYSSLLNEKEVCYFQAYVDHVAGNMYHDSYFAGFGFTYLDGQFMNTTIVIAEHLKTNQFFTFILSLEKEIAVGREDIKSACLNYTSDMNIAEFNRMLEYIEDEIIIIPLFMRVYSYSSSGIVFPILKGPMSVSQINSFYSESPCELNYERDCYSDYHYYEAFGVFLLKFRVFDRKMDVRILSKSCWNMSLPLLRTDSYPEIGIDCW
jgi:hypothetical protein